ncbi:MAG TPA: hypothetical protein VGN18_20920 [Jatrophihabitans sp.]|jgi:hypothetical protein|uniref:hypothetical protein n=1 Tax=Jatrophihabitans sp. TaxID=1932789 RepID=UPI002DFB925D|nr:hypothetical protein [Jatrophihabitans sp.]
MNMPQGPGAPNTFPDPQAQPGAPAQHHPAGPHGAPTVQFVAQNPPPPKAVRPKVFTSIWTLGLVSLLGVVLGISLDENGVNAWHSVHAWGGVAVLGAVLTLAPVLGHSFGLTPPRARQVAAGGAGALVLYWVLFVLPVVGSNTSLLTTIGVAAGVVAARIPQEHSW